MTETRTRYSAVSLALHWVIAALVVGQILLIAAVDQEGPNMRTWAMLHKADGIMILLLTLVRIGWRVTHPMIPLPAGAPRWQGLIARTVHVLFYLVLIALPMTGWLASSAMDRPMPMYGLFDWPLLPIEGGRAVAGPMMDIHRALAKSLYILLILHLAGGLKHYFIEKNNVLQRMLPFLRLRA